MNCYRPNYNSNFSFVHGGSKPPPYDKTRFIPFKQKFIVLLMKKANAVVSGFIVTFKQKRNKFTPYFFTKCLYKPAFL